MSVQRFNLAKPEKFTHEGEEKTKWHSVGVLVEITKEDGTKSRIVEVPSIGLKANAFPFKEDQEKPKQKSEISYPKEDVNVDDIPF